MIHWDGVVLTRDATSDELGALYTAQTDPTPWLAATPVVDSTYPRLVAVVTPLVAG